MPLTFQRAPLALGHRSHRQGHIGDFNGVSGGVTQGLLFPASPAFSPDGTTLYVTNLELDLRTITKSQQNPNGIQTVDSQWA
ncbi:MAG: hypothetical protein WAV38_21800, partial [Xanthobacteraceae bacterium]